jgi:N-dimethylarginine dimethylaminohydrolase
LLEAAGFTVFETPLDEFIKAGGSAKCLVLKLA